MKIFLSLLILFSSVLGLSSTVEDSKKSNEIKFVNSRNIYTPETTDLGIESDGVLDIATDNSNTVHIIWSFDLRLWYGQIKNRKVVNQEEIPNSAGFKTNFIRPRLTVRPDNGNVHITWMSPRPGVWLVHVWKDSEGWHDEDVWKASGKNYISVPFLVEDLTGTMHAIGHVWTEGSSITKVKYWTKKPGGTYNAGWTLIEEPKKWRDTSMFIDSSGGVHATYKSGQDPGKYNYCKNGGTLIDSKTEDIPIPSGNNCVSFGDLFVTDNGDVHHVFLAYNSENIYYSRRDKTNGGWSTPLMVSEHKVEVCHHKTYDNPWPSIAINPEGVIYMAWADSPCPDNVPNRLNLAVYEKGKVTNEVLTLDAEFDEHSKPAICGNDNGVYLLYRDWHRNLILYTEAKASFSIENFSSNQKVCAKDYEDGTEQIKVAVGNPEDFSKVEFFVDGTSLGSVTAEPFVYDWNVGEAETGEHTLKIIGTPNSGDPVEDEVVVDVDCPPVLVLPNLFENATVYETFTITTEIEDDKNDIARVDFYIDGVLGASDTEAPFEYVWDTANLELGEHSVRVIAYDSSSLSDEVSLTVKYWPIFPPENVSGTKSINRSIFIVNYYSNLKWDMNPKNTNNPIINIVNYRIYLLSDGERTLLSEVGADVFEYNHENVEKDGEYIYLITSIDAEGNESSAKKVVVK